MQLASDIMTKGVVTVNASATVAEAMQLMKDQHFRDLVVAPSYEGDAYGIMTEADVVYKVAALGKSPESVTVGEIMTKPCVELDPEMTVQEVAQLFANHHIHRAPVIKDELLGVVTIFDIVRETMWWQG
jgi:CBS domain-containing protein